MKWIIVSVVILCTIIVIRCNYPYFDIMSNCKNDDKMCHCMAKYVNSELSYSEYKKLKNLVWSNNVGKYILLNLNRDDPVSKVLLNAPMVCQNPFE